VFTCTTPGSLGGGDWDARSITMLVACGVVVAVAVGCTLAVYMRESLIELKADLEYDAQLLRVHSPLCVCMCTARAAGAFASVCVHVYGSCCGCIRVCVCACVRVVLRVHSRLCVHVYGLLRMHSPLCVCMCMARVRSSGSSCTRRYVDPVADLVVPVCPEPLRTRGMRCNLQQTETLSRPAVPRVEAR
jgi:hypothetical protein